MVGGCWPGTTGVVSTAGGGATEPGGRTLPGGATGTVELTNGPGCVAGTDGGTVGTDGTADERDGSGTGTDFTVEDSMVLIVPD